MLKLSAVHKHRPGLTLRDVDLSLQAGSAVLLSGPTGAGKSTLLALARGDILADAGAVEVLGRDLARLRTSSLARLRRRVGVVPQTLDLLPGRTVRENVALPLDIQALPKREIEARVSEMLEVMGLAELGARRAAGLSLGQAQLVAFARALVSAPSVLLADEPTAHLDNAGRELVIEMLGRACAYGCAALVASNDHKLLERGAHLGFSHVELADGTLQVIAERELVVESLAYECYEVEVEIEAEYIEDDEAGGDSDVEPILGDNIVQFPARVA